MASLLALCSRTHSEEDREAHARVPRVQAQRGSRTPPTPGPQGPRAPRPAPPAMAQLTVVLACISLICLQLPGTLARSRERPPLKDR